MNVPKCDVRMVAIVDVRGPQSTIERARAHAKAAMKTKGRPSVPPVSPEAPRIEG